MDNRQIVSSRKMTWELIGGWLIYSLLFGILLSFIIAIISNFIESKVIISLITILSQGVTVFFIWKCATASSFKKKTISFNDVSIVMRNLIIFTVILCVINCASNFIEIKAQINEAIEYSNKLNSLTNISIVNNDNTYKERMDEKIEKLVTECYIKLAILEIGFLVIFLGVLPLEKKEILKYIN